MVTLFLRQGENGKQVLLSFPATTLTEIADVAATLETLKSMSKTVTIQGAASEVMNLGLYLSGVDLAAEGEVERIDQLADRLEPLAAGVWGIDAEGEAHDLNIPSAFALESNRYHIFDHGTTLFCSGAVSDRMLQFLSAQKQIADTTLIMRDFTRLFATPATLADYRRRGGKLEVLRKNRLLAVCVNPVSPRGYRLDSARLCGELGEILSVPVYDLMQHGHKLTSIA